MTLGFRRRKTVVAGGQLATKRLVDRSPRRCASYDFRSFRQRDTPTNK